MKQYTYCIKNIKNGDLPCSNPKVVWITGSGQAIPCPDRGTGCITIKVPDDISACVKGEIICEDCGSCPSKPFEICPCSTSQDCDSCQTCVNGICTDLCDGNCINGQCIDCVTSDDCAANKICINGKCQCPVGLPYVNSHGDCVNCLTDNNCSACEVCIGGACVPKVCPSGVCDPVTGFCVECQGSGDCYGRTDGKNCCNGVACDCCPGFRWNPQIQNCEPEPKCVRDTDCPICEVCAGGECQPRICPDGFICVNDDCVPTCDCNEPTCSRSAACIRYNSTTCICQDCSGSCADDIPCKDGCICVNNNCVPNVCNAPCATGADCGPGCGCLNNQCVPCEHLSCSENNCFLADGCRCYGSQCKSDPCKGPCENGADCGPGCGCLNGNCVSCDILTCDECPGALGCLCNNNVCLKDSPCSGDCVSSYDCGPGCTCYNGKCVNCSNFSCEDCTLDDCECKSGTCQGTDKECTDIFTLTKLDAACDLKATLIQDRCCTCEELELKLTIVEKTPVAMTINGVSVDANRYRYQIRMFRDGAELGNTIINDFFQGGSIRLKSEVAYTKTNSDNTITQGTDTQFVDYSFVNQSSNLYNYINIPNIKTYPKMKIQSIKITLDQLSNLGHNNGCIYTLEGDPATVRSYTTTPSVNDTNSFVMETGGCRNPVFRWYRASGSNFVGADTEFRYIYATKTGDNTWEDTIKDCSDGLCSNRWYKVTTDCGCKTSSNEVKAVFCPDPMTFEYQVLNCGKTLIVTNIFDPCDINSLLTCTDPGIKCFGNLGSYQVEFKLTVYDDLGNTVVDNLIFSAPGEIIGRSYTTTGAITRVTLEHNHDAVCKIDEEVTSSALNPSITHSCTTNLLTVNTGIPGCNVTLNNSAHIPILVSVTDLTGVATFTGVITGTYIIDTNCAGCTASKTVTYNCCNGAEGTMTVTYTPGTLSMQVNNAVTGQQYDYVLTKPDATTQILSMNQSANYNYAITLTNGNYSVTATDNNGCKSVGTFTVNNCSTTAINAVINYTYVPGPPVVETLSITGISGSVSPYTVTLKQGMTVIATNSNVTTNTSFNAASLISGTTYTIDITDSQNPACTKSISYLLNKQAQCSPAVDLTITTSGNCAPIQYNFWVNNAVAPYTIYIKSGGGIIVNGQTGEFLAAGPTASPYIVSLGQDPQFRDLYYFQGLPDGPYTIEVVDSRGCKDTEIVNINCICSNPIITDIEGIICDDPGAGTGHLIKFNSINGGEGASPSLDGYIYKGSFAGGNTCQSTALIDSFSALKGIPFSRFIASGDTEPVGGNYYVKITDGGLCMSTCIAVAVPDCSTPGGGGGSGSPDCPLTAADFNIVGDCNLNITNNSLINVQARVVAIDDSDCQTGNVIGTSNQVALGAGATLPFVCQYPGLQHRLEITYPKQVTIGDPVPCTLYICAPCSTAPTCTLTTQPDVCKTRIVSGACAGGYIYKLNVTNTGNTNSVKAEAVIDGGSTINLGVLAPGGFTVFNVGCNDFSNVYVKFTCMNDLTETIDITINNIPLGC
jgi:hypothetical protein